jgi:hypothetical protein
MSGIRRQRFFRKIFSDKTALNHLGYAQPHRNGSLLVVGIFEADEKNAAASKDVFAAHGPPQTKRDKLL